MRDIKQSALLCVISLSLSACNSPSEAYQLTCKYSSGLTTHIEAINTTIGDVNGYPEERIRSVDVDEFNIDIYEVTNADFNKFVSDTGYVTTAERPQLGSGQPGGAVFKAPTAKSPNWWQFVKGANWRNPEGPGTSIDDKNEYPVVQVSLIDAKAYAAWAGRSLPSEAQWEVAARAGAKTKYVWGEERAPDGIERANTWQGAFPIRNTAEDGYIGIAPAGCFDPNAYGLHDMIGNVWEWTLTEYNEAQTPNSYAIKGGSFLCAKNYCARYRAPARQAHEVDFSTNHIGFRTVSKNPHKSEICLVAN